MVDRLGFEWDVGPLCVELYKAHNSIIQYQVLWSERYPIYIFLTFFNERLYYNKKTRIIVSSTLVSIGLYHSSSTFT